MDIGSGKVTCLNYHGELNLEQALGYSCNLYFAQLAEDIGAENLKKKAEEMGFGKTSRLIPSPPTKAVPI